MPICINIKQEKRTREIISCINRYIMTALDEMISHNDIVTISVGPYKKFTVKGLYQGRMIIISFGKNMPNKDGSYLKMTDVKTGHFDCVAEANINYDMFDVIYDKLHNIYMDMLNKFGLNNQQEQNKSLWTI